MDHSIRGYLNRCSDAELKVALQYCREQNSDIYQETIGIILEILEKRSQGNADHT